MYSKSLSYAICSKDPTKSQDALSNITIFLWKAIKNCDNAEEEYVIIMSNIFRVALRVLEGIVDGIDDEKDFGQLMDALTSLGLAVEDQVFGCDPFHFP